MSLLSRDEILSVDDRQTRDVEVPEWNGSVRVRAMSGFERDQFESSMVKINGNKRTENFENLRARMVQLVVVDEDGKRLFPSKADVILLGNKSAAALQRVFNAAQELNGMSDSDVEELTESFDETPDESSISD